MAKPRIDAGVRRSIPKRVCHHREISRCFEWFRARRGGVLFLEGAFLVVLAATMLVLGLFGLDNLLHFRQELRFTLLLVALVSLSGWALYWLVLRPLDDVGDIECARLLERRRLELDDHLLNTVSFDSTHHRETRRGLEGACMEIVEEETIDTIRSLSRKGIFDLRKALRWGVGASLLFALVATYALVLPRHFRNAMTRFLHPLSHVAALTETRLQVRPGDVAVPLGEDLTIVAEVEGRLPERAVLFLSYGASPPMDFDGRSFSYRVEQPAREFTYRVSAGDAESDLFTVEIRRPPEVKELDVTVRYPRYTGLPPRVDRQSSGNVAALKGSEITLEARTTRPVQRGRLRVRNAPEIPLERVASDRLEVTLRLERDLEYDFHLSGEDGSSSPRRGFTRRLTAVPDHPPTCEVIAPGRDLEQEAATDLPITLRLRDDVGLSGASLLVALASQTTSGAETPERATGGSWRSGSVGKLSGERDQRGAPGREREAWNDAPPGDWLEVTHLDSFRGAKEALPSLLLDVEAALHALESRAAASAEPGASLQYCASAVDLLGQKTFSRVFAVKLLDRQDAATRRRRSLERVRAGLSEVLRRERALYRGTRRALDPAALQSDGFATEAQGLSREQEEIRELCLQVLARRPQPWATLGMRSARLKVTRAARTLMPRVAADLARSGTLAGGMRSRFLEAAARGERRIIELLSEVLGRLEAVAREGEKSSEEAESKVPPRSRGVRERLEKLIADLEEFARAQKEVIARTSELAGVTPEDFTAEEEDALEELAATEEKWGKYLEEKGTDLSKVAPQDMSLGTVLEEVVEMVEEIDLAKNYLEGRNVELAVPAEQAGAALAEEIETNLERWLSRDRDRLKWVMEEPTGEFDVPLADLPSELEDIIGELIDQEELMGAETEDITSSWLDSMDDGIGWDAMDGPISNMSAKGVTGNLQPNDMEIGGRAGEGRSGKSQGQFVEETATGKGGRQTPTRSTPDPFEAGEVKDTSRDPAGGSTGGGKLAGEGEQGLRGKPSPELDRRMGALAGRQTKIRQEAEKVSVALRRRRYYPQNLERAIELMAKMQRALSDGRPYRYETLRRRIVSELRATKRVVASQLDHRLEESPSLPVRPDDELLNAGGEEMPREYRDLIRDYYRSLAAGHGKEPRDRGESGK